MSNPSPPFSPLSPQSPGSDPLSLLLLLLLGLRDAITSKLPEKHGNSVKSCLMICIVEYGCIWSLPKGIIPVVQNAVIAFLLSDENVRQLTIRLDAAIQHYNTCINVLMYYTTGDLTPGFVEPPPITIMLPPNATTDQITQEYTKETRRLKKIWRESTTNAFKDKMSVEDELKQLVEDKMKHILDYDSKRSSPEFDFMNVLIAAGNITVTNEDDDNEQGDNFVNADEVGNFVQACKQLLPFL